MFFDPTSTKVGPINACVHGALFAQCFCGERYAGRQMPITCQK
jgi:hypothetical protein